MGGAGVVEDLLAAGLDGPGAPVVHGCGGVQPDPGMAVVVIVIGEEDVAECACFVEGGEAAGKCRTVFEGLELRFGIGVVVGDVRPGMAAGDVRAIPRSLTGVTWLR